MKENLDGELYLYDAAPPDLAAFINLDEENPGAFELLEADTDKALTNRVIFERAIFKYKDPTSPPHTKKECAKWAKPWPGSKICVGWKIQYRWVYRIGIIRVGAISESEARTALEDCLKQSAIAAAIAGIASGGSAAVAAAEIVLKACLATKLGEKLISLSISVKTSRGDWE